MPISHFQLISRRTWLWLGFAAIVGGHALLLLPWQPREMLLVPVVVTAVCVILSQRHTRMLIALAVGSAIGLGALEPSSLATWTQVLALVTAQCMVGLARQFVVLSPWGPIRAQERLSGRIRRQSEQLQAAIQNQESTERTVLQFESDRRALLEYLPVHVVQKDSNGCFTFVTQSFCDLVNRDFKNIIGKTDHDLFPEEAARKFVEDDRQVMSTGKVFNDVESTQLPNGAHSYMRVRKAPLLGSSGEVVGVQGIFWDVTDEFSSRRQLQRIESLAHALINAALDAVLIVDAEGRVLEANPASEKILGYTQDQVASHPLLGSIMHTTLEEPAGRASDPPGATIRYQRKTPISEILKSATGRRIEARLRRSNDIWFDAEISAHPLEIEGSQDWAIFIRDITNRKRAEKELRSAKEAAEQANAAKSDFVANVSHELRTPLTGIIGLHELLANSEINERQQNYLELAKVSAANLLTLIDDLLDFSKIEAGRIDIDEIHFSLVQCVEEAASSMAARAQLRGLELMIDFEGEIPAQVEGDPHRIRQILLNLIGNAIKFTEKGDIRVKLSPPAADVQQVTAQTPQPAYFRFEIHDSGIGISSEQRELIFEAFHQADSSTTRRYGGTGLGLTICRDLVAKMGGQIGVENARQLNGDACPGSCFYFELPLKVPQDPLHNVASPSGDSSQPPADIIIASRPAPWREILIREIERLGFRVSVVDISQLLDKRPSHLFAAGNKTIVIADFRELSDQKLPTAPVVEKWILLTTIANSHASPLPPWLTYATVSWLSRPICRDALKQALSMEHNPKSIEAQPSLPATSEIRSADLLLVEDSPISQTVLKDMLLGLGHRVRVVGNGREAIAACRDKVYDLVLMDIQMPDVDGFEATRTIRQQEEGSRRRQHIYALTAHATAQDRTSCEAAGMDGFLVKPIPLESLRAAVHQATAGRNSDGFSESDSRATATTVEESPQQPGFHNELFPSVDEAFDDAPQWPELVQLMHGNEPLLRDVLSLLAREAPRLGRDFQASVADSNFSEARRAVHTLKSNVRYVGLNKIGDYALHLENMARDQQAGELKSHSDNLLALANAVADWSEQQLKLN
jgi:two-component system sensor histidine kinase/response regulator